MNLRLLSVNVAQPRIIGEKGGEPVMSGIGKVALKSPSIQVSSTNIDGDAQADLRVHGGPDKAVYAYSADHWSWWEDAHSLSCAPASFGENLTLAGAGESDISIGDRFRWGDVLLEVSQPRAPCYKLGIHAARPDLPGLMTLSARCGWYFRVVEGGTAPTSATTLARVGTGAGPSVHDAFTAAFARETSNEMRRRLLENPSLAPAWLATLARRFGQTST